MYLKCTVEKEMASHSSVLARKIQGTEEPSGLQSMGSQSRTWLSTHKMYNLIVLGTFAVIRSHHHGQYEYEYHIAYGDGLKKGSPNPKFSYNSLHQMESSIFVLTSFTSHDAGKLRLSHSMYVPSFILFCCCSSVTK